MMNFKRTSLLYLLIYLGSHLAVAETPVNSEEEEEIPAVPVPAEEVMAIARLHIGSDELLDNVRSLVYRGIIINEEADPVRLEMLVRHPYMQRLTLEYPDYTEVLVLNGFDAQLFRVSEEGEAASMFLPYQIVNILIANTAENLSFFDVTDRARGTAVESVLTELDGQTVYRLVTRHPGNVKITRYFDAVSGRLLSTIGADGTVSKERGEFWVDGIRFPRETVNLISDGQTKQVIQFTEILVNHIIPESAFELRPFFEGEILPPPPPEVEEEDEEIESAEIGAH